MIEAEDDDRKKYGKSRIKRAFIEKNLENLDEFIAKKCFLKLFFSINETISPSVFW